MVPPNRQFTLGSILFLTALVALLVHPASWATILFIEFVATYFVIQTLAGNLPTTIRAGLERNCVRKDGSFSQNRAMRERKAVRQLKKDLYFALFLILIPSNALLWFVHHEVIPLPLGMDAMAAFRVSESEWKSGLSDVEKDLQRWHESKNTNPTDREKHKRLLWKSWPLVLVGGLAWILLACRFLAAAYDRALKDLQSTILIRAQQYAIRDYRIEARQDVPQAKWPPPLAAT